MDSIVAGLNKVHCTCKAADDGKTVTISNTYYTWSKVLENTVADFVLPYVPAPEKKPYTINLVNNGTVEYTRTIELGYGDSVNIGLYEEDEPAKKSDIDDVEDELTDLEQRLIGRITGGTVDLVDGSSPLQSGYLYCYY